MGNGVLSDDKLFNIFGGADKPTDTEDISSDYISCSDWVCRACGRPCADKIHICGNGGISKTVCRYCRNYDSFIKNCRLGKTVL